MNTSRAIIGEIEQLAVDAIVHQPDELQAAERHFSDAAKKIVEKAMQAVDIMEIGDVCRRAVTGAAIQDYDLLAKLLTDKDFDHDRLGMAIEALGGTRFVASADGMEPAARTFPDRKTAKIDINYADGYVYMVKRQGRKLVGVVEYDDDAHEWRGQVYDGEEVILDVGSVCKGKCFVSNALRAAMYNSAIYLTHAKRHRQNRKAKRAAALSPDAELAATVARQQGDDDLAERMENA